MTRPARTARFLFFIGLIVPLCRPHARKAFGRWRQTHPGHTFERQPAPPGRACWDCLEEGRLDLTGRGYDDPFVDGVR